MDAIAKIIGGCLGVIIGVAIMIPVCFFFAWICMLLWNAILPVLFVGFPTIGYWQMLGLMFLTRFVFGSFNYNSSKKD